ncbi:hypothetical protein [Siccirubricoccus sp. G192]|uniref:hypothetical protein n=1 Tax=Siccirubricoccus sp. G192 TaxID=2849651 RepID=UPI001C2C66D2|nr:hypothetical protein [Siccirubricoccus sp. G192]MBV1795698.1 hypothetical protein [Siccirubricoccus sp. G192]
MAGLLALALLVLPAAPLRHASAAPAGHQAAVHCVVHDNAVSAGQAADAGHHLHGHLLRQADDQGQPCDDPGGKAGLACCVSAQCPAMVAAPPLAATSLLPSLGPSARYAFETQRPHGIDVAPALPPPREAA